MRRTSAEIQQRCQRILKDSVVVELTSQSSSPNAAYIMVVQAGFNAEVAKAARWLAILRRDYPDAYQRVMDHSRHVPTDTARKELGHEGDVYS